MSLFGLTELQVAQRFADRSRLTFGKFRSTFQSVRLAFDDLASTSNGKGASQVGIEAIGALSGIDNVQDAVAELATRAGSVSVVPGVTVNAQADAVIAIDIATEDQNGVAVARVQRYWAQLYTDDMIAALAAAFTMAETGSGTEVSNTAQAGLLFDTHASGLATLAVTDVAAPSGATLYVVITPVSTDAAVLPGTPLVVPITFA